MTLLSLLHKFLCWLGFHHYHELSKSNAMMKLPEGMVVEGRFCCRCHDIDITNFVVSGKKQEVEKAGLLKIKSKE